MRKVSPSKVVGANSRTLVAIGVSVALWGTQAVAQDTTALEEVVVTGSFIQGTPEDASQPVETITFEELQNVGRPSNLEMVKMMSEVGQVAGETDRYNSFPIGAATVNLRNLGQRFTTVIFNGRRFPEQFSPVTGRFNNIAWIPNAAVGSVEVLKGGGAVTYGADAVAGVVNYITRKDVDGLELNADYRYIEDSDGDYNADMTWGSTFDRGNVMLSAAYQHRSNLQAIDREWARQPYMINNNSQTWGIANNPGAYAFQTTPSALGSITRAGAGLNQYTGDRQIGASGIVRDNNCSTLGGFAGFSTTGSPACYFQQTQFEKLVEQSDTFQLYGEFNYQITDSLEYTAEVLAYDITLDDIAMHPSDGPLAFPLAPPATAGALRGPQSIGGSNVYYVAGRNPGVANFLNNYRNANGTLAYTQPQIDAIVSSGRALLPQFFWRPFATGGNPLYGDYDVQENSTRFYRTTQALGGDLPEFGGTDLRWDVALTYNYVKDRREARDMLVDRLQAALNGFGGPNCTGTVAGQGGCQWLNPFPSSFATNHYTGAANPAYVPGLENSIDLVRWLYTPIWLEREYKYFVADLLFSGKTGLELPGGPIAIALGAQYRRATEDTRLSDEANRDINPCATLGATDCTTRSGSLAFTRNSTVLGATVETERKFPVHAAFVEAQFPVLDSVTLQVAGRYEKFISDLSDQDNDIFVPAASLRWQATDWMALRGSWGKTFSQVNPPAPTSPVVGSSTSIAAFGGFGAGPGQTFTAANYPNQDVEPMKGSYINVGFLFQAGGFQSSLDVYEVVVDDYARTMSTTNVVNGLVVPGQVNPGAGALINCSSPLLSPQAGLGGRAFVELNGACSQGVSALNSPAGTGGLAGGRVNYFGGTDETNAGELMTRGIDVVMSYTFDNVFGGELRPSIDGSYVLDWELEEFKIGGSVLANGYDGVGFVNNTSTGRIGQAVPEWRGTLGLNYHRDIHNLNIAAHFLPSLRDEDSSKFIELNSATNANVGDANGFTNAACADTNPTTPPVANGSGTGQFGTFCAGQNTRFLAGQEIDSSVTVDMTYRVQLPAETAMSLSIFNVTDEDPPFARTAISYLSGFGNPLGRSFKLQLSKQF
jgi:iron complex outermembrane receptor protein